MPAPRITVEVSSIEARTGAARVNRELAKIIKKAGEVNTSVGRIDASFRKLGTGRGVRSAVTAQKQLAQSVRRTEAQLRKQNRTLASATQQFKNLRQRIRLAGGDSQLVARLTNSFRALERKLKSGALSAKAYDKAMIRFRKTQGRVNRELKTLNAGVKKSSQNIGGLGMGFRNLGSAAVFAVGPLSGVGARLVAFSAISARTGVKVALMAVGFAALAVASFKLVKALLQTDIKINRIISSLTVATGSVLKARREFSFVAKESLRLGISIEGAAEQFAQLSAAARGTSLTQKDLRKIFTGVASAASALGLTTEATTGAFRALQQMISKGTVQAEELRGQLGERIPGAFQLAAKAMGVTTRELGKMLEQGQILAEDLLPKLADELLKTFSGAATLAASNLTGEVNRFSTAILQLLDTLEQKGGGIGDFFAGIVRGVRRGVQTVDILAASSLGSTPLEILETLKKNEARTIVAEREIAALKKIFTEGPAPRTVPRTRRGGGQTVIGPTRFALKLQTLTNNLEDLVLEGEKLKRAFNFITDALLTAGQRVARDLIIARKASQSGATVEARGLSDLDKLRLKTFRRLSQDGSRRQPGGGVLSGSAAGVNIRLANARRIEAGRQAIFAQPRTQVRGFAAPPSARGRETSGAAVGFNRRRGEEIRIAAAVQERFRRSLQKGGSRLGPGRGQELSASAKSFNRLIKLERELQEQLDETRTATSNATAVLKLRIKGLSTEADRLEIRNELETEYGDSISPRVLNQLLQQEVNLRKLENAWDSQRDKMQAATEAARDFSSAIGTAFEDALIGGKSLREVFKGLLADLTRIILRVTVTKPFETAITKALTGGGGLGGIFDNLLNPTELIPGFGRSSNLSSSEAATVARRAAVTGQASSSGGFFADLFKARGGPVFAGQTTIVGEKGPEVFVPKTGGTIIPNQALRSKRGGGDIFNINVQIDATDLDSFESPQSQTQVANAFEQILLRARGRNG